MRWRFSRIVSETWALGPTQTTTWRDLETAEGQLRSGSDGRLPVGDAVWRRLTALAERTDQGLNIRLPLSLKTDPMSARVRLLQRLATSRQFALGDRSGVLRAAARRARIPFRCDVRQRVIVKALVSRHVGRGAPRAGALRAHLSYLGRPGAGEQGQPATFFDRSRDGVDGSSIVSTWTEDRHHFRFIISPEHGDRIADLQTYVREVMARVAVDLGEPGLNWIATAHYDTDQPHAHVLVRGRRADGRDLIIPRDYIGYGFRSRAQEVAQELMGDLTRLEAERRVWMDTKADRFTGLDRRLLESVNVHGLVSDGIGNSRAWSALTRGRLRHLERLGLATRCGAAYRLAADMEAKLRGLQMRRDIIRTFNQRRLDGAQAVRIVQSNVRGVVVSSGCHDELGSSPWVVIRDDTGMEHYARLRAGTPRPEAGKTVQLALTDRGLADLSKSLQSGIDR